MEEPAPDVKKLSALLPITALVLFTLGAQPLDELYARQRRQAEINDGQVERVLCRIVEPFASIFGSIDRVASALQLLR